MLEKPSLIRRAAIGKIIGLAFGLIAFFALPLFVPDLSMTFRLGVALYLIMMGCFIGIMGVLTYHPVLHMPMPWWVRGPLIGGFMMLILWMLAQTEFDAVAVAIFGEGAIFSSGAWSIVDGIIIGALMSFLATRFGGEGKETVDR
ncbi:hypothetical protein [Maritalea mediterranea]|uniref:SPW repeat-containing protein n=1 Tax=Maritalea mediterranea TaxID=2909667 RepID=A0ABS9E836_9HYPH|nr:hypothetical protein [Maritalea mediterranea]MCF4099042.1 hypothetical protein [Maritalea mediterranea]